MSATNEDLSNQLRASTHNSEIEVLRQRTLNLKRLVESYELYFSDDGLISGNIVYANLLRAAENISEIYHDNAHQRNKYNTYVEQYEKIVALLHSKLKSIKESKEAKELSKQAQSTAVKSETGGSSSILTQFNRDKNEKVSPKKASSETSPEESLANQLSGLNISSAETESSSSDKKVSAKPK